MLLMFWWCLLPCWCAIFSFANLSAHLCDAATTRSSYVIISCQFFCFGSRYDFKVYILEDAFVWVTEQWDSSLHLLWDLLLYMEMRLSHQFSLWFCPTSLMTQTLWFSSLLTCYPSWTPVIKYVHHETISPIQACDLTGQASYDYGSPRRQYMRTAKAVGTSQSNFPWFSLLILGFVQLW